MDIARCRVVGKDLGQQIGMYRVYVLKTDKDFVPMPQEANLSQLRYASSRGNAEIVKLGTSADKSID